MQEVAATASQFKEELTIVGGVDMIESLERFFRWYRFELQPSLDAWLTVITVPVVVVLIGIVLWQRKQDW